jgi:hypothetical protein
MASLTNTKIKNTYVSLLKVADNGQLDGTLQDITDGAGNTSGVQLNTGGDLSASGTVAFGSLKDSGENITISKFVDAADGIGSNNNDTTVPTSAAVTAYVASQITLEDLDFAGDSGTGSVDLDSQTLTIQGTANEIETVAGAQTLTIGLPSTINVNVTGNLTGNVNATSVLIDGVIATTQATSDNSTKVATTAFVKSVLTLENLDIAGTSGTGSVDLDSQALTIAGTTNEIETIASGQTITVGLPSDVIIGNDLTVTTDASVGGILDVTGAAGVDGNFDVATNKFTVQAATGNTLVAGTLGVTGNTTLSTVDVTGLASLDGGIDVDGAFTVSDTTGNISTSGDLGVTGTSTLGVINASGLASLDGGIDVDGAFTVADSTGNVSTTGTLAAGATTITGLLDVTGEVQATFLDINGNGEVSGNLAVDTDTLFVDSTNDRVGINKTNPAVALDVTGAAAISSTLAVTGTTSLTDDLAVDNDTLFVDASADRVGINKNNPAVALDVTGDITSSGTITGTTLAGTLSTAAQTNITSVGTLTGLTVSADASVNSLTVGRGAGNISTNTALGSGALNDNTTGNNNTATGLNALVSNTTGTLNVAVGSSALVDNTTGNFNTASGANALSANTTGSDNTANGKDALINTTGSQNTASGAAAGFNLTTGSNNSFLGFDAQPNTVTTSNEIVLGNSSITTLRCQTQTISALSDARDKKDVKELVGAEEFIKELRPVSFVWNQRDGNRLGLEDSGFIAQELLQAQEKTGYKVPNLVLDTNPDKLQAAYAALLPTMVSALQSALNRIDELELKIKTLESK